MRKKQYLANGVLHCGRLYRNAIVAIDGDEVTLRPFAGEEAGTVFVSGIIVVCRRTMLTTEHVATLTEMVKSAPTFAAAAIAAADYVAASNLYLFPESFTAPSSAPFTAAGHDGAPELVIIPRK
jgi:hypothetical protein